jgi:hypothetical protein
MLKTLRDTIQSPDLLADDDISDDNDDDGGNNSNETKRQRRRPAKTGNDPVEVWTLDIHEVVGDAQTQEERI